MDWEEDILNGDGYGLRLWSEADEQKLQEAYENLVVIRLLSGLNEPRED